MVYHQTACFWYSGVPSNLPARINPPCFGNASWWEMACHGVGTQWSIRYTLGIAICIMYIYIYSLYIYIVIMNIYIYNYTFMVNVCVYIHIMVE